MLNCSPTQQPVLMSMLDRNFNKKVALLHRVKPTDDMSREIRQVVSNTTFRADSFEQCVFAMYACLILCLLVCVRACMQVYGCVLTARFYD